MKIRNVIATAATQWIYCWNFFMCQRNGLKKIVYMKIYFSINVEGMEAVGKKLPEWKIYKLKSGRREFKLQQDIFFVCFSHIRFTFSIQIYLKEIKVLGWNKFYVAQKGQTNEKCWTIRTEQFYSRYLLIVMQTFGMTFFLLYASKQE